MATESDSVNTGALATIVAVGGLATLAIALAVTALVRTAEDSASADKSSTVNARPFRELRAGQTALLTQPAAWVDKTAGVVSIPIERAMNLVVSDFNRDPQLATPVSVPKSADGSDLLAQAQSAAQGADASAPQGPAVGAPGPGDSASGAADKPTVPPGGVAKSAVKAVPSGADSAGNP